MTDTEVAPSRALVLSDADRKQVYSLITAALGDQGVTISADEFAYFLRVAELRGLNPLFREVHLIKDRTGRINVQVGIDGFRKIAEDSGEYAGQTEPLWGAPYEGPIAAWQGKPGYCRVGVIRKGWDAPLYGEAWLDEDGATRDNWVGDGPNRRKEGRVANAQWETRPRTMLKKVAEARAIRAAFPRQVAGLYTEDELPGHAAAVVTDGASPSGTAQGALQAGEAVSEGSWAPDPGPEGLQGVVEKAPDGIRRVKVTRHGGTEHDKVEIVFKVSNRRHTAILLDAAAHRGLALEVQPGEVLRVIGGAVEEIQWSDDATKPKKKELWGATDIAVLRDGAWVLGSTLVPDLPLDDGQTIHADGTAAAETVRLVAAVKRGTDEKGRHYARFRGAVEGTGEIIEAVLGEKAPGELDAMVGPADAPAFAEGDEVRLSGLWQKGWLVATFIGWPSDD